MTSLHQSVLKNQKATPAIPRIMFVLATMLSFMAFTPVAAQDRQEGMDAYNAGDYANAL